METLVINNVVYVIPAHINEKSNGDVYTTMFLQETFFGHEDWEKIDTELNGNFLEDSETFEIYGRHYGINADEVEMDLIRNSLFATFINYDGDEWITVLLEPLK